MQKAAEAQVGRRRLGGRSLRGLFGGRCRASGARDRLPRRSMVRLGGRFSGRKERITGNTACATRTRFRFVRERQVVALVVLLRNSACYQAIRTKKQKKIERERKNQQPLVASSWP